MLNCTLGSHFLYGIKTRYMTVDSKFFINHGPLAVARIAEVIGDCEVIGNPNLLIKNVESLEEATENDISFLSNAKYRANLKLSKAGAFILREIDIPTAPEDRTLLITQDPYLAYAKIMNVFYSDNSGLMCNTSSVSADARIHDTANVGSDCCIEAGVVVSSGVSIGDHCRIFANAYVGPNVQIGDNTYIGPNVCLSCCYIGSNCIIHPGAKIGHDGFGFTAEKQNILKIKQIGKVIIGNNVEIGANTCVERAALHATIIGDNTKIGDLVAIGHNVVIGKNCLIVNQSGIAGSTVLGDGVRLGGQVGIAGHLKIGDRVMIAAQSGVMKNAQNDTILCGTPAVSIRQFHRQVIFLRDSIKNKPELDTENA
ncbi:UDP-3-O-acylglucosamine N-acyltransferase [Alphaproteobacteria bacterium]